MSSVKRIRKIIKGIVMLICSILFLIFPSDAYYTVVLLLDISLLIYGIRMLIYYLTMSRFMVGGMMTLYKSIIAIDFGLFMFNMNDTPKKIIILYLAGVMAFHGLAVILNAMEARKIEAPFWKRKMLFGTIRLVLAVACICLWNYVQVATIIYSIGLMHGAINNIVTAFHKTAIIHIE